MKQDFCTTETSNQENAMDKQIAKLLLTKGDDEDKTTNEDSHVGFYFHVLIKRHHPAWTLGY